MSAPRGSDERPAALDPQDATLILLARAARGRAYVLSAPAQGAAVRDVDGRTYSAATVDNESAALLTTALRGAVVAAASSGARAFEAAVVVGGSGAAAEDLAVLREFGTGVPVLLADADGTVLARATT